MSMSYHVAGLYLIKTMYGGLADYLFGDDDEEDKNFTGWEYIWQNTLYDMAVGQVSPSIIDGMLRYIVGQHKKGKVEAEGEAFNATLDSPIFAPRTIGEALVEGTGQYGDLGKQYMNIYENLSLSTMEALDILEDDLTEEQHMMIRYQLLQDIATLTRLIPLRGDVQKLLREKIRRAKKDALGGSGSDSEGTEFAEPTEYENTSGEAEYVEFE